MLAKQDLDVITTYLCINKLQKSHPNDLMLLIKATDLAAASKDSQSSTGWWGYMSSIVENIQVCGVKIL